MDPALDPAIFFIDLQNSNRKLFFFLLNTLWRYTTSITKIKSHKEVIKKSQKSRNQGFSYYFCLITEGSGAGSVLMDSDLDPGGPKTYGSDGSRSALPTPSQNYLLRYQRCSYLKSCRNSRHRVLPWSWRGSTGSCWVGWRQLRCGAGLRRPAAGTPAAPAPAARFC